MDVKDGIEELSEATTDEQQLAVLIDHHWGGLLVDCEGDELSEGGQSLRELERLEAFEAFLSTLTPHEIPTFHHFSDGIYMRQIDAPKDAVIIGHEHLHPCLNIMTKGRVLTISNGNVAEFSGPCIVNSGAYTRKASIVVEDMTWITVHPNPDNERDLSKLEARLFRKSPTFLNYESRNDQAATV